MDYILKEILEEPEAVKASIQEGKASYRKVAERLLASGCDRIYAVGCGSSYFTGILARYALERFAKIPTIPATAVDFYTYSLDTVDRKSAVIAISQSGESFETIDAARKAKGRSGLTIGLTNNAESRLAGISDEVLLTAAGPERASGTKTVLTQMLAAYQFALAVAQVKGTSYPRGELDRLVGELDRAVRIIQELQERLDEIKKLAGILKDVTNLYMVGAGPFFPLALQITNTAREIAQVHAYAFEVVEFRHGPLEIIRPGSTIVIINNSGCPLSDELARLAALGKRAGASLVVATDVADKGLVALADHLFPVPATSEILGAIAYLAPFHLVLYHWAVAKGLNPNEFRNIVKTWTEKAS
ncbi:MAG TPA: SIS domain-containing protein [Firmicutes bacterium]|nr:SIS domain-containing protein [Bacillota bacterium]